MVQVNAFGQIQRQKRPTFPTVLSVSRVEESVKRESPPARPPTPVASSDERVIGEVVSATTLRAERDDEGVVHEVQGGRYELFYPMVRIGDEVRMRAKVVEEFTGEVSFQWLGVYREVDGRRERCVRFSSA